MAKPRVVDPVGYYHLNSTGSFGRSLYEAEVHRDVFLNLYARVSREFGWQKLSYCLMTTHYHLLIKLTDGGLSKGMQQLNGGFSRRMNLIYGRTGTGHLFKNRFHDSPVVDETHFKAVVRYVALNPVAAGACDLPEDWPWSSHRAILGLAPAPPFLDVEGLLEHFGRTRWTARAAYKRLVLSGLPTWSDHEGESTAAA